MAAEYSIEFNPAARREWKKLSRQAQEQLTPGIDALATNPRPSGIVKLKGNKSTYRVRSGNFRIIYQIQDAALIVLIVKVGHRREIYK